MIYNGENQYTLYLQAGYGLSSGIDLALRLNLLDEESYLGADLEFALKKTYLFPQDFTALTTISVLILPECSLSHSLRRLGSLRA